MNTLSVGQLKSLSSTLGNISVAWFTAGIITPLFAQMTSPVDLIPKLVISLFSTLIFIFFSLRVVKIVKS